VKLKGKAGKAARREALIKRLAPFIKNNAVSKVEKPSLPFGVVAVKSPWGDTSIEIVLPSKAKDLNALIEALNNVVLPERFTALWHVDTQKLEFIYTTYPTHEADRSFVFKHRGSTYECTFGDSSNRLLLIAEAYYGVGPTSTDYRNLDTFSDYALSKKGRTGYERIPNARPLSFWINGLKKWDTDKMLDLALHLNFYMSYYDPDSGRCP